MDQRTLSLTLQDPSPRWARMAARTPAPSGESAGRGALARSPGASPPRTRARRSSLRSPVGANRVPSAGTGRRSQPTPRTWLAVQYGFQCDRSGRYRPRSSPPVLGRDDRRKVRVELRHTDTPKIAFPQTMGPRTPAARGNPLDRDPQDRFHLLARQGEVAENLQLGTGRHIRLGLALPSTRWWENTESWACPLARGRRSRSIHGEALDTGPARVSRPADEMWRRAAGGRGSRS